MYEAQVDKQDIDVGGYAEIMINSGVSVNYVPTKSYQIIMNKIAETKKCTYDPDSALYYCHKCSGWRDKSFPTIRIRMGSLVE